MKKIECYIQPYNLDTVAEVKGFGVQKGFTRGEDVKAHEYRFHPKMKVEMVVLEKDVERIVSAIVSSLKSNQIGEGKIFVTPVEDAVRTRTGERGRDAIK